MTGMRPKISAFVITKNNGDVIGDCLASLAWADEIVVVDDLSTDATQEICLRHGARVLLELDSDERVSEEMRREILALREDEFTRCAGFEFPRLSRFWGKWIRHASFYPDRKLRLYDRRRGSWSEGNIHERFIPEGAVLRLPGDILHVQDLDLHAYIHRTARYARLSAEEHRSRGRKARWHHFTVRPVYTFLYRYFVRLGFLDGVEGFVISAVGAFGTFLKYMTLYELDRD
ncbi:MAG: UDP-glucose--lipopolysaccharide core heptose 4-beta-glucosyltransferase [Deltaproteobacteria bacterium]|nr:UDP-glucose--lipopolysaccharide core heptose 4-beta-glucosyltransferase [Deltaproteobacteria bacterium]